MKWLFIVAIVVNLAFLSYNLLFSEQGGQVDARTKSDQSQIRLLSELTSDELTALASMQAGDSAEGSSAGASSGDKKISEENFANVDSEYIRIPDGLYKKACYELGPFSAKEDMDAIKINLENKFQNRVSFSVSTSSEITYYRIYIPPLKSKNEIKDALEKLTKKGLTDHYVMSIDGRKNAIALGVFKQRDAAEKIAQKAKRIGFSTTIEGITKDKDSQYFLQVDYQGTEDASDLNGVLSAGNAEYKQCENNH